MAVHIRRAAYYYVMVKDRPGESYRLLSLLAQQGVDLLAFSAVPLGGWATQLVLFPADTPRFLSATTAAHLQAEGPHHAFLITGDDQLGACAEIHRKLAEAQINVFSSNGVTDERGGFGYLIHVRPEDYERAAKVLEG
jgi:predicted amino acid-binding ACT domain protein